MLNKIILHGRLGKDPELQTVNGQNGTFSKASFSLAVPRDYGDLTDWFYCSIFGKRAEALYRYCRKGQELIVCGSMQSFKSTNDEKRTLWSVKVDSFDFCGKKETEPNTNGAEGTAEDVPQEITEGFKEIADDDFLLF